MTKGRGMLPHVVPGTIGETTVRQDGDGGRRLGTQVGVGGARVRLHDDDVGDSRSRSRSRSDGRAQAGQGRAIKN